VLLPAVLAPLAAVLLAACGGSSGASPAGGAAAPANQSGTGTGGARNGPGMPGVTGKIAEVSKTGANGTLQVQDTNSQTAVSYTAKTRFSQTVQAKLAVGDCVTVLGTPVTGSTDAITATSVRVTALTNGACTFPTAGQGRPRASGTPPFPTDGAGPPAGTPGTDGRARQSFATAVGKVTSVSGTAVVVSGTLRSGGRPGATPSATPTARPTGPVTVAVSAATTVTKTVSATSAAAVVGKCAAAFGKADSSGTVAATAITISTAGPDGCTRGFGGFGGRGGGDGG
jgi:hypothetical protein